GDTRAYAEKIRAQLALIPSLRDLQVAQSLNYPAVRVDVDRERAGLSGVTVQDVSRALVSATSSSRFVVPVFWADPKTGIGYQVQVEVPPYQMSSTEEVGMVPIKGAAAGNGAESMPQRGVSDTPLQRGPLLLRDVARVRSDKEPGEYDRYNMRRIVSM